jgi:hypothetical protein
MIDVKFEIGGRQVDPSNIGDAIEAMLLQAIAEDIHKKVSSIRYPETGEAPVVLVRGNDLEHLSIEVSGSEELVRLISEQLGLESGNDMESSDQVAAGSGQVKPWAFLCHASEDKPLARQIAHDLHAAGIETFFDEWEIRSGDSLRQKIDNGLEGCTHFLALLSPISLTKPWVNAEMDGAFMRKLDGTCRFIALRHGIPPEALPPLIRGSLSPSLDDYENDIKSLISDIYEVSRKPPLGSAPVAVRERKGRTGLSAAGEAIARLAIERSQTGTAMDPQLSPDDLRSATGLTDDDIIDGMDELEGRGFMKAHATLGCGRIGFSFATPESELFASLDQHFMDWSPEEDALRVAADMVNGDDDGANIAPLAQKYGWEPRRMNPAIAFLANRRLADVSQSLGTHPWICSWIRRTPAMRRFVRDRSQIQSTP